MEEKFRIISNENHHIPQLSLMGVFDEPAAASLVEAIMKEDAAERIIVNTNCLTMVNISTDAKYLQAFADIGRVRPKVFFCGEHASAVAPESASVLY